MFDEKKARRVIRFIECLKHTKGEFHGKPFKLLPWQEKIIRDVFGTVRDEEPSMRQYNQVYIEIGKKNGKSELGAALALNMLVNDDEWKAEVYSCASDRQQAAIVFDVAVDMVRQNPTLSKLIKIIPSTRRMVYQPTGSIYQVLSSEVATKHGLNVSACIFDELHTQPTRALYDVMTQGSGDARKQPLWFFLTTAGTDRNSVCWEVHQKALDILEGRKHDPRFYPVVYGLPDDADWQDEQNWYKCNPSLGYTITIDKVRDAYHKALETPADENMFRQLRLNQWVKQSIRWMPMDKWDECGGVVDPYQLEGRACYAGLVHKITTSSGDRKIPLVTARGSASWIEEEATIPESDDTFGQVTLGAHKVGCMIRISEELLHDSAFDLAAYIAGEFARRVGAAEEEAILTGSGTHKPTGLLHDSLGAEPGVTAASAVAITADELIDLQHSVKSGYRRKGLWIMNDATLKLLRKLKDGQGNFIWQLGLLAGQPDTLLNQKVMISNYMPLPTAGNKAILYGDLSYYWLADREGRSLQRLDELYAAQDQVGFKITQRVDGRLLLREAVKCLQMKAA